MKPAPRSTRLVGDGRMGTVRPRGRSLQAGGLRPLLGQPWRTLRNSIALPLRFDEGTSRRRRRLLAQQCFASSSRLRCGRVDRAGPGILKATGPRLQPRRVSERRSCDIVIGIRGAPGSDCEPRRVQTCLPLYLLPFLRARRRALEVRWRAATSEMSRSALISS